MKNEDIISLITSFIVIMVVVILLLLAITYHHYPPQYLAQFETPHMLKCDTYVNTGQSDVNSTEQTAKSKERFKYASPEVVTQLYKLIYMTDKIFTENGIEYWVDGGSYLGAVRHKGIIPWDDDLDIQIWDRDEALLKSLQPEFAKHNMVLHQTWFGHKLYFNYAAPIKGYSWLYPSLDIFPVKIVNDKMIYSYPKAEELWGGRCYHNIKTLYPLKRYKFGAIEVFGPSESSADKYFTKCYDRDWKSTAYQIFDHESEKPIDNKVKIKLTPEELRPAEPTMFDKNF